MRQGVYPIPTKEKQKREILLVCEILPHHLKEVFCDSVSQIWQICKLNNTY